MLKGDALEPQSWLRCPLTCVGQDATPASNLAGAILILFKPAHPHVRDTTLTTDRGKPAVPPALLGSKCEGLSLQHTLLRWVGVSLPKARTIMQL